MSKLISRYKPYLIFLFLFTVAFFILKIFIVYFLPFILGIAVSFIMYPVYSFMKKRLSFKPSFSATVITLFIFLLIFSVVFFILYLLIRELYNLYVNNSAFFNRYLDNLDLSTLVDELGLYSDMFSKLSDTAFGVVKFIPIIITFVLVCFVFTVFFLNKLHKIKEYLKKRIHKNYCDKIFIIADKTCDIMRKFVKSYLLLYTLTFLESVFIFSLIKLDYVLVFAFLAAVSDLLPILGPGAVYLPVAIIKIFAGDYLSAVTLVIFWAIVVVIRQIIEPKILSDNIKIHPILIFTAIYFSVVSSNLWILIYIMLLFISYKILLESGVIVPVYIKNQVNDVES